MHFFKDKVRKGKEELKIGRGSLPCPFHHYPRPLPLPAFQPQGPTQQRRPCLHVGQPIPPVRRLGVKPLAVIGDF